MVANFIMGRECHQLSWREEKLLQVMVRSYLTGPCTSIEIEEMILRQPHLRALFPQDWPAASDIRRLRRSKRDLLIQRLAAEINGAAQAAALVDLAVLLDCIEEE